MKTGRIGYAEGIALTAISLFINGLFSADSRTAYANGNSTYLSIPLAVMLSLILTMLLMNASKNDENLPELMRRGTGRIGAAILSLPIAAAFVLAAAKPLVGFAEVLHRLVFDGVSYWAILLYVFPVTVFIAWKGFESLGRLALIFSGLILASVVIAAVSASPEFDSSRLYPLLGTGPKEFLSFTASETLFLLPPLIAAHINLKGLNGREQARKIAVISALLAALLVGLTQLALGLIFPYKVLAGLLLPLYRINFLSLSQSYVLRLDKLFIMVWLTGSIISSAYLIFSASLLVTSAFGARNNTPAVLALSFAVLAVMSVGFTAELGAADALLRFETGPAPLLAVLPLLLAAVLSVMKRRERK